MTEGQKVSFKCRRRIVLTFSYAEDDPEFERWTHNLFKSFIVSRQMKRVALNEQPSFLLVTSTALRVNSDILNWNIPLVLAHNEAWSNYWPPCGPEKFKAVLSCCHIQGMPHLIRFPYYAVHFDQSIHTLLEQRKRLLLKPKTKFCCFVVSNDRTGHIDMVYKRIDIFDRLNAYKKVDAAGPVRNNVGYLAPRDGFIDWISDYKFMICLENTKSTPEYLTEKPFQAWFAGTVPIYDGTEAYTMNRHAFVDASWHLGYLENEVKKLDADDNLYEAMRQSSLISNIQEKFSLEEFERNFLTLMSK